MAPAPLGHGTCNGGASGGTRGGPASPVGQEAPPLRRSRVQGSTGARSPHTVSCAPRESHSTWERPGRRRSRSPSRASGLPLAPPRRTATRRRTAATMAQSASRKALLRCAPRGVWLCPDCLGVVSCSPVGPPTGALTPSAFRCFLVRCVPRHGAAKAVARGDGEAAEPEGSEAAPSRNPLRLLPAILGTILLNAGSSVAQAAGERFYNERVAGEAPHTLLLLERGTWPDLALHPAQPSAPGRWRSCTSTGSCSCAAG